MELEKAIEIIKQQGIMKTKPKTKSQAEIREALQCLVEAGEKQIPKNPIELDKDWEHCKCPICDKYVVDFLGCRMKYCRSCGQAIKFE